MADDAREYGAQGGKARAAKLSPEERAEIARAGAKARWEKIGVSIKTLPRAQYGSPDRPLLIGNTAISAYVLDDGRRVLAQRGLQTGLGFSRSGGKGGARRLVAFMESLARKGIDTRDLAARVDSPIRFIPPHGGNPADGYEAEILPDICAVIIEAEQAGALSANQVHLARQAAMLQHGFATLGIIGLVDEVTGFQADRARDALAKILQEFVQKELRRWVRTFPTEFYQQLFRLRELDFPPTSMKMPQYIGTLTNNVVYDRLAPGVKAELKRLTPRDARGRPKNKLFQRLTEDVGHPKLREHLASVIALMKISPNWAAFESNLDVALPKWSDQLRLPGT